MTRQNVQMVGRGSTYRERALMNRAQRRDDWRDAGRPRSFGNYTRKHHRIATPWKA